MSERCERTSERANKRASGPVLQFVFSFVLDHSALLLLYSLLLFLLLLIRNLTQFSRILQVLCLLCQFALFLSFPFFGLFTLPLLLLTLFNIHSLKLFSRFSFCPRFLSFIFILVHHYILFPSIFFSHTAKPRYSEPRSNGNLSIRNLSMVPSSFFF